MRLCFTRPVLLAAVLALGLPVTALAQATRPASRPALPPLPPMKLSEVALQNFGNWDQNRDDTLSAAELDTVLLSPETRGTAAAAAAALKNYMNQEARANHTITYTRAFLTSPEILSTKPVYGLELTEAAAAILGNLGPATQPSNASPSTQPSTATTRRTITRTKLVPTPQAMFDRARRSLLHPTTSLYGDDATAPDFTKLRQGNFGDCYLISVLGARTHIDPTLISSMIAATEDPNIFTLTWGDGTKTTVPALTEGEIAVGGASTAGGLWVRIFEKALTLRKLPEDKATITLAADGIGKGGNPRQIIQLITGHKAIGAVLFAGRKTPTPEMIADRLKMIRPALIEALAAKRLVALSTPSTAVPPPGMSPKHAYAVLSYNEKTDVVTIWNPHANNFLPKLAEGEIPNIRTGYPTRGGIFSVPLKDMAVAFNSLSWETPEVLKDGELRLFNPPPAAPATRKAPTTRATATTD